MKDLTDWVHVDEVGGTVIVDGTVVEGGERFIFWHNQIKFCGTARFAELMWVGVEDVMELDPTGWSKDGSGW